MHDELPQRESGREADVFLPARFFFTGSTCFVLPIKGFRIKRRREARANAKSARSTSGDKTQSASSIQTNYDALPNQIGAIKNGASEAILPDDTTEKKARREANL